MGLALISRDGDDCLVSTIPFSRTTVRISSLSQDPTDSNQLFQLEVQLMLI